MRYLLPLLFLTSCATARLEVSFPDHSEESDIYVCQRVAKGQLHCLDYFMVQRYLAEHPEKGIAPSNQGVTDL